MIKSLSTYNLIIPFVSPLTGATCSEYTLSVYVWSGIKTAVPATAEYDITKSNYETSTGNDRINIGRLVNDFISFAPVISTTTEVLDTTNQMWCKTEIVYTTTDPADDGTIQEELTQLILKGYGYGNEGENAQPQTDGILLDGDLFRVARGSVFNVPIVLDSAKSGTVISYPNSEVNYTLSESIQTDSDEIVKLLNVVAPDTDEYITITIGSRVIYLIIKEEYKYTPLELFFINKEGAQQSLTFFKERKDSLNVTREQYESFGGQAADGYHNFVDYNVNGKTSFIITSGFVPEGQNEAFKQLLLSTKVYVYESGFVPVNVSKTDLQYQTRLNERLISYDFNLTYSYNEINTL